MQKESNMKAIILACGMSCAMACGVIFAEEKAAGDPARKYVDEFLAGHMQPLLDRASPELSALMKDTKSMQTLRANTIGENATVADEQVAVTYARMVKSAKGQTWSITASVSGSGQLVGFLIRPAGEAPSDFLDYKTKAALRLPFAGTWTVFWGGRSVKENYHAAYPDQRFADDIVVMKNGTTHSGRVGKNEDFYCFGQPLVSPGSGVVVSVVDGIADNVPGKMNPTEPCGNHVVLDLRNDEYLFMAHLQNGSVKMKPGDHVKSGDAVGLCGNTGNSSEPHLHIHLQTTPRYGDGKGLPLQFQHYQVDGKGVDRGEPSKGQAICDDASAGGP
ncbi:MAG TPA: M23 family metallopeptidase [Pirellulales bacterium]